MTFPRLLELEQQLPVELQKALASTYPLLETRSSVSVNLGSAQQPNLTSSIVYDFLTRDRMIKVSLASTFIAVTAATYTRWQDLRPHLTLASDAVIDTYDLRMFTRIGLRYVNAIEREQIGLDQVAWRDLIRPPLLGLLGSDLIPDADVLELQGSATLALENGKVTIRHGLGVNSETKHPAYLLDYDFYTDSQTDAESANVLRAFDDFNEESGRVFRWCITDRLHEALQPEPTT
jgi:uncharacterized protein (TIGR04255 family)